MSDVWHMVQCRMMLDFRRRPREMIVEEELNVIQQAFSDWLDERYDSINVDLCSVTHEGLYNEDEDPHPEGWGLSEEELWELIPGDTDEEKRKNVERAMRDIPPEELQRPD